MPGSAGWSRADAPADAPQTRQDPDADEKWADMFPVPEGFTLEEYPPLSEEQFVELTRLFRTGKT